MADDGKNIRVARTNIGEPNLTGLPTQHSQVVAHDVHQFRSDAEGLEGLSNVFDNFFGTTSRALAAVNEGVITAQKQQIDQENAAQKRQALGDALEGKPMDPKQSGDLDYYDAFRQVTAQRDGYKAAQDFNEFYLKEWLPANPTGDLMAARQDWSMKNLTGSQDADYQGQVLANFFEQTDGMIGKHQEFALKYQTAKGTEALGQALDAKVASGTMDAGSLADFIEKKRVLDPLNAAEAPAAVASALLASAQNHPEQMGAIANLLTQDGTGVNGKSFAASWPDTYADFQNKATASWNSINSMKDLTAITDMKDRIRGAKNADDLLDVAADVYKFRQTRGGIAATDEMLSQIATLGAKFDAQEQALQGMDGYMGGNAGDMSPSDVRKYWPDWLERTAGTKNIMDLEPEMATKAIEHLQGVVPEEVKQQLSAAITNDKDAGAQAKAITMINTISDHTGKDYVKDYLSDTAAQMYENVWAISQTTSEPIESIVARVNEGRSKVKDWGVDWKTITKADTAEKAQSQVNDIINSTFFDALGQRGFLGAGGSTPQLPLDLYKTISDAARSNALAADASGRSWQDGLADTIKDIASKAEVIPGPDGKTVIQLNADRTQRYLDENGKEATRPRLGTQVENFATGQIVNTIDVFHQQTHDLSTAVPWVIPDGDVGGIGLAPVSSTLLTSRGLMAVTDRTGVPITFAAGDKVTEVISKGSNHSFAFGTPMGVVESGGSTPDKTTEVTIPSDPAAMEALFAHKLPEGFKLVPHDTPLGVTWQLAYRPNFGSNAGKTLDQQIANHPSTSGGW